MSHPLLPLPSPLPSCFVLGSLEAAGLISGSTQPQGKALKRCFALSFPNTYYRHCTGKQNTDQIQPFRL